MRSKYSRRLDAATARAIFTSDGLVIEIAKRFGVSPTLVSLIKRGKLWTSATSGLSPTADARIKITSEQVRAIFTDPRPVSVIAAEHKLVFSTIYKIHARSGRYAALTAGLTCGRQVKETADA